METINFIHNERQARKPICSFIVIEGYDPLYYFEIVNGVPFSILSYLPVLIIETGKCFSLPSRTYTLVHLPRR